MSDALYERYKDALRRGHVAAQRGRLDEALDAYGEAARIAPDRASPMVGIGQVLVRLEKPAEAASAFDLALERAPDDETALRGRADLHAAHGDRIAAAATLDRLAAALDASRRTADSLDAASHALELAESRSRRATLQAMVDGLTADPASATDAVLALSRANELLAGPIGPDAEPTTPSSSTGPPEPPFDAAAAMAAVESAAASGDAARTRSAALAAARGHRAAGQPHAAIDACYQALATNPADPSVHLALAELYIDRGWRTIAADKLVLLAQLVEFEGDAPTRARLCDLATRLPDDARLEAICA